MLDGIEVADAAAELNRNRAIDAFEDRLDAGFVFRLARGGAVEVNHMQATRALLDPLRSHRARIVRKNGGIVHVALLQAHTLAVLEINRRDDQHAA